MIFRTLAAAALLAVAATANDRLLEVRCTSPDCSEPGCMTFPLHVGCKPSGSGKTSALRTCSQGAVFFAVFTDARCGADGGAQEWNATLSLNKCYQSPDATSLTLYSPNGHCDMTRAPGPPPAPTSPFPPPETTLPEILE